MTRVTSQAWAKVTGKNAGRGRLRKTCTDNADVTWRGRSFQVLAEASGKARPPTVDSRVRALDLCCTTARAAQDMIFSLSLSLALFSNWLLTFIIYGIFHECMTFSHPDIWSPFRLLDQRSPRRRKLAFHISFESTLKCTDEQISWIAGLWQP